MVHVIDGNVNCYLGANSASAYTITNLVSIGWRTESSGNFAIPEVVMNSIIPIGWYQPHKWITGEMVVLGSAETEFGSYISTTVKSTVVPYFVAQVIDSAGTTLAHSFSTALFTSPEQTFKDGEVAQSTYRFVATAVSTIAPR